MASRTHPVADAIASAGLSRLPPALMRWVVTSSRKPVTRRHRVEQGGFQTAEAVLDRGNTEQG